MQMGDWLDNSVKLFYTVNVYKLIPFLYIVNIKFFCIFTFIFKKINFIFIF